MPIKTSEAHLSTPILAILILAAMIVLPGCDILPPEPTITPTLTATQTETPTPTVDWFPATLTPTLLPQPSPTPLPTMEDMRTGVTELLIDDDFVDESLWSTRQSLAGNVTYGNENLTLAVARPETSLISRSHHHLPENFYLEMSLQTLLCQPEDQVGLLFWMDSDIDYYRLLINCAGQVRLELVQRGRTIVLYDWVSGAGVQPGTLATNRFGLYVSNGLFQLYINDIYQFEHRIAQNRSGDLGVFARTISGNALTVRFLDLQIYRIEAD
jgi:hypothetical protein